MQLTFKQIMEDIINKQYDYIPKTEGVYVVKDKAGEIKYIGKGVNLKRRIKQFVYQGYGKGNNHRGGKSLFALMGWEDFSIEFTECENAREKEKALIQIYRDSHNGEFPSANKRI